MSEEIILPSEVENFLNTHPSVLDWGVIPDKVKCIDVILKEKRDLIKFPSEYEGYRLYASLPDIPEEQEDVKTIDAKLVDDPGEGDEFPIETEEATLNASKHKEPKTDDELRQLAMDIVDNKVFTDRHMQEHEAHMLGQVFMPIIFMDQEQSKAVFEDVGMVYEYYSEAGPRSVNGLPMFMSVRFLSNEETNRIAPMIKEIQDFKRKFLGKKEDNEPKVTHNTGPEHTEEQSDTDVLPLSDVHATEAVETVA